MPSWAEIASCGEPEEEEETGPGGPTERTAISDPADRARSEGLAHLRAAESFVAEIG
jgi:hypothetical protein